MIIVAEPVFTIVMPLFNKAAFVGATLASLAAQTFQDFEVVVVDDGSTDGGPALVEAIGGKVRLLRQSNAGPGLARNTGVAAARGEWIAFLDADDLWRPDHLQTVTETIHLCPDADVIATGFGRRHPAAGDLAEPSDAPRYIDFFREHHLIWTSAVAARRSALLVEPFGAAWPGEDVELWIRLALHYRFAVHPARTATYVQRTGGAMDSQTSATTVIARQPVFATLATILADPAQSDRHPAVSAFRDRLLIDYARPALFHGQIALTRAYLGALSDGGAEAPRLYRLLAHLPGPIVAAGARLFGATKRLFGR